MYNCIRLLGANQSPFVLSLPHLKEPLISNIYLELLANLYALEFFV